jgi:hypothetical protein
VRRGDTEQLPAPQGGHVRDGAKQPAVAEGALGRRGLARRPGRVFREPEGELLDLARPRLGEAARSRDHTKAALLQDAPRRDVVGRDVCVERARPLDGQERGERAGRDPLAPMGAADPVGDLALVGVAPRPDRADDLAVDDDRVINDSSARSLDQRRSNASQSVWPGVVNAAICMATGSAHCSNSTGRSPSCTARNTHSMGKSCQVVVRERRARTAPHRGTIDSWYVPAGFLGFS